MVESEASVTAQHVVSVAIISVLGGFAAPFLKNTGVGMWLLRDEPRRSGPLDVFVENILVWISIYGAFFVFFQILGPHVPAIRKRKFEPTYTPIEMVLKEIRRNFVNVLTLSAMEVLLERSRPWSSGPSSEDASPLQVAFYIFALESWSDIHFYSTHRFLHIGSLYKKIHKIHHESNNPNAFSGISMHPVEGALFFSAVLIPYIVPVPYFVWRAFKFGVLLAPIGGHLGHGWQATDWHYQHHKTTIYNYGSTRIIDGWFGSDLRLAKNGVRKSQ